MTKDGDKATLLCEYVDEAGTRQTEIYYIFELMDGSNTNDTKWNVFYNKTGVISNLESGFNPKYFLDALKAIEDEEVFVDFGTSISPCVIRPIEDENYTYMILPIRMKE